QISQWYIDLPRGIGVHRQVADTVDDNAVRQMYIYVRVIHALQVDLPRVDVGRRLVLWARGERWARPQLKAILRRTREPANLQVQVARAGARIHIDVRRLARGTALVEKLDDEVAIAGAARTGRDGRSWLGRRQHLRSVGM